MWHHVRQEEFWRHVARHVRREKCMALRYEDWRSSDYGDGVGARVGALTLSFVNAGDTRSQRRQHQCAHGPSRACSGHRPPKVYRDPKLVELLVEDMAEVISQVRDRDRVDAPAVLTEVERDWLSLVTVAERRVYYNKNTIQNLLSRLTHVAYRTSVDDIQTTFVSLLQGINKPRPDFEKI